MIKNKPMEHYNSSTICVDCVNKECKSNLMGSNYMTYSSDCERYYCMERKIEEG